MNEMMAYCGIGCGECPARLATVADDDAMRAQVAQEWSKNFGLTLSAGDVNCVGCKSEAGPWIGYCAQCGIRSCARDKGLDHCAQCADYGCETLSAFHQRVPMAKQALDALRS